jgi:hypothetical protein
MASAICPLTASAVCPLAATSLRSDLSRRWQRATGTALIRCRWRQPAARSRTRGFGHTGASQRRREERHFGYAPDGGRGAIRGRAISATCRSTPTAWGENQPRRLLDHLRRLVPGAEAFQPTTAEHRERGSPGPRPGASAMIFGTTQSVMIVRLVDVFRQSARAAPARRASSSASSSRWRSLPRASSMACWRASASPASSAASSSRWRSLPRAASMAC